MEIKDRIAAFEAKDFAKAFEGFDSFDLEELKELALKPESEIIEPSDWVECYIEEESSYLFYPPNNMQINSDAAKAIFGNPGKWIINIDNMDGKKNYIGAISIIEKKDFLNPNITFPLHFSELAISKIR